MSESVDPHWQPFREPLSVTLARTGLIALIAGAVAARWWGGLGRWPVLTLVMLWPSFGGHWVDLWFLNWLRPRLSPARGIQMIGRIATWFIGGIGVAAGMTLTARALLGVEHARWPLWVGGLAFIAIELVAQLALELRGRSSFFGRAS